MTAEDGGTARARTVALAVGVPPSRKSPARSGAFTAGFVPSLGRAGVLGPAAVRA
ncbi:hypothetical protein ACH4MA_04580 [Streptomyces roseolus]|uniref:hypothetical protein n=1 Tax=Streptomyces roseolus TaxID=67358 RepID=UPI00379FFAB9